MLLALKKCDSIQNGAVFSVPVLLYNSEDLHLPLRKQSPVQNKCLFLPESICSLQGLLALV